MVQERFSQLVEMQVEAWTRLTRLRMLFGDTIGSQYTAEKCLGLVAAGHVSPADEGYLNPRVWRWIRYVWMVKVGLHIIACVELSVP